MSASYDFGDTSCPFYHLSIISHLLTDYHKLFIFVDKKLGSLYIKIIGSFNPLPAGREAPPNQKTVVGEAK